MSMYPWLPAALAVAATALTPFGWIPIWWMVEKMTAVIEARHPSVYSGRPSTTGGFWNEPTTAGRIVPWLVWVTAVVVTLVAWFGAYNIALRYVDGDEQPCNPAWSRYTDC